MHLIVLWVGKKRGRSVQNLSQNASQLLSQFQVILWVSGLSYIEIMVVIQSKRDDGAL